MDQIIIIVAKAPVLEAATPWMAIVYSLVAAVGIGIVGFKSCHRTHLD